eukprot:GFUD01010459.1.p1 GENE.GFUD01010459.1~~GFUD01010459.1.p1  ORF type:complete len:110 (+),score=19.73 GFUD01010459.1:58-387(+)
MARDYITTSEEQKKRLEQFRSWHDEAYLYIHQAITQERPDTGRKDVALTMYQKGLELLDLGLCVDMEIGLGLNWEKGRKMQQKMSKTRSHVQSRILQISEQLSPSLNEQ